MGELSSNFEAFRYWLGELWTTRPWLGVADAQRCIDSDWLCLDGQATTPSCR